MVQQGVPRDEFKVPHVIFDYYYNLVCDVPGFKDKMTSDGLRGRRSHPLKLKLAAWFQMNGENLTFRRAAKNACIDRNTRP